MSNVILLRGRAGVGKTTISNELAKSLRIAILRKDDIYDSIVDYIQDHDTRNKLCYQSMYQIMQTNLKCNADLIVDAPFPDIKELQQWITRHNGILKPILCICSDEELWARRFNQRKLDPKPNNVITDFDEMKRHYGELSLSPIEDELVLDSIHDIDVLLAQAQKYLAR